jgi:hypothetical protein
MVPPIADVVYAVQARVAIDRGAEMATELSNDLDRGRLGNDLVGFAVDARDGCVGKVERVNYQRTCMVVTTGRWLFRRRHVVPTSAVASVDPGRRVIYVRTSMREILGGPTYDDGAGIDEDRETEAEAYYAPHAGDLETDASTRP